MRMITLWQPWASLMAWRAKRLETRSWGTPYRGELAIHAAAKLPTEGRAVCALEPFYSVLCARLRPEWRESYGQDMPARPPVAALIELLPLGAVLAVGDLVNITEIPKDAPASEWELFATEPPATVKLPPQPEISFGIYTPGRRFWQVDKLRALEQPVPAAGAQGLRQIDGVLKGLIKQFDYGWNGYVDRASFRASGECLCPVCGVDYLHHAMEEEVLSYQSLPFLHRLCTGELVKL